MQLSAQDFTDNIESYLSYRNRVGYSTPETSSSNRKDLLLFSEYLKEKKIAYVSGKAVISFQEYLALERENTPSAANRKIFTLRAYQKYLILNELQGAKELPFNNILKIRGAHPLKPNFLKPDEIKLLFSYINIHTILGIRDYAVNAFMYLLGMRVGEVYRLKLSDLDFVNNTITITGKRERMRLMQLTREMKTILENYLAIRKCFYRSNETEALFLSKKGNPLAIRTMEDNFNKLVTKANIKSRFPITCHTLRHSCATELNEKKVDLLTIQNILGHSSPKTTMTYYVHATEKMIREAFEKLPLVQYLDELILKGEIKLTFQNRYRKRAG